jgi:hypothetical protein
MLLIKKMFWGARGILRIFFIVIALSVSGTSLAITLAQSQADILVQQLSAICRRPYQRPHLGMESYRQKSDGVTNCTIKSVVLDGKVSWRYPADSMITMFSLERTRLSP